MKFTITKSRLLEGLQTVQNVVSARSTLPILANVLLTADDDGLTLTTTDLDISVCSHVPATTDVAGATTLPVRRLFSIIRELPDGPIEIDIDEDDVARVQCGSSFFRIIGLAMSEFPPVPVPEGQFSYNLDEGVFREMLRKTAYAASTDETRHVLNGVLMCFKEGKLTMVATDGRRLALVEHEVEFPPEAEKEMILPTKSVNELLHILGESGDLRIFTQQNQVMFQFGEVVMSTKLIDGVYPNYRQVIPAQCEERITIERELLFTSLRRVALLTTDKSNATRLTFADNQLVIVTNTPDVGEARETLPIKYTGPEISVIFNPEYMMDPLKNLSNDEIYIELNDGLSPGVIKCDIPFLYVLMPLRVS